MVTVNSISVRNVSLRVPITHRGGGSLLASPFSLLASLYAPRRATKELRTILDDLTIAVEDGHRLALIGPNGAGKTTLLRVLAGAISPTRGTVATRGKVQALLNISQGFRGEATGLENIYLRGLSMGMSLAEIRNKVPEIVEFTELGDAIYDPIHTYSAGMRTRLAFAVATSHAPNILLMDEWISAGDRFFLRKAQERLQALVDVCRALVLASHSTPIIHDICSHGLVMDSGRCLFHGKIDDALKFYDEMVPVRPASSRPHSEIPSADSKVVISRTFDASRDRIWKAWSDPQLIATWWAPKGFKTNVLKLDLRQGGVFHYGLKPPQGHEMWFKVIYRELEAPRKLALLISFSDEKERTVRNPFNRAWPLQTLTEATLDEHDGMTTLTIDWAPFSATDWEKQAFAEARDSLQEAVAGMLDKLDRQLARVDLSSH
jgi:ABC-type polysaccharide/polyol phosphate transport system ATPase subunit/uncharacterized protein YndB with AHSA1/START domain